ncbi:MAG: VWA domain-containing protein [Planctomycetales bacterium]|nr:VWA domain-containing protein [Planctomycetales bacterium]MBN8627507.1 VWA domain-containing protein [Planctomycetota bacterium]
MAEKAAPAPAKTAPAQAAGKNATAETQAAAEGEEEVGDETPMMSRNVVWGLTAGGSSMVVHLALLLILGLMGTGYTPKPPVQIIESSVEPPREQEEITQKLDQKIQPSTSLSAVSSTSASASATVGVQGAISAAVAAPKLNTTVVDRPTAVRVDVGAVNVFTQSGSTFAAAVPEGTLGEGLAASEGYGDAMDRITQEILNMLAKRKVIVCWAFDQSESMQDDREEVQGRVERVYQELGLSAAAKDDALLTGVVSYGAATLNHTPQPTYKPEEIMAAIKAVPNDPSGAEMQCMALNFCVANYQKVATSGNRQMAIIMVTDESGDMNTNISQLEATIQTLKQANIKVYILGRESVFGYPYARMRWADEFKQIHWIPIDRGPETPQPEQLQINGFHRRHDAFPSGFGPYEQSRIARQTGGIFFMLPSPEVQLVGRRADIAYDADAMRPFLPDLSARNDYVADRDKSPFRQMIFKVISDLNPYQSGSKGSRVEVRTDQFPIEPPAFAKEATENMKKAQDLILYLQEAQKALESVAAHRAREKSPRWRANYDLIYAQSISYQARLQEYGWYLAEFMKTPKAIKNPLGPARPTNGWDVGTVKRLLKPEVTQATREKADALFREIQKEYAGTPWAWRATEELGRGYGIELHEDYWDPRSRGVKVPKY